MKPTLALLSRLGVVLATGSLTSFMLPGCAQDESATQGQSGAGAACESAASCGGDLRCSPGGREPGCGQSAPYVTSSAPCASDAECAASGYGPVCHSVQQSTFLGPTCSRGCADDTICANGSTCETGTGRCVPKTRCTNDSCSANEVCASNGACTPRLCGASSGCGPGLSCDALYRCSPAACDDATPCPTTFACTNGRCLTRSCATTADCPDAFCLDGRCVAEQGRCYQSDIICGRPLSTDAGLRVATLVRGSETLSTWS